MTRARSDIAIVSYGLTDFGRSAASVTELAAGASRAALAAAAIEADEVDALCVGTFLSATLGGQNFLAAVLAARLGLRPANVGCHEAACASGSVALKQAISLVRSGDSQVALVVGVEKMTASDTETVTDALARAADVGGGGYRAGLTFPGFFALVARAYMAEYGVERSALADVAVKNRQHGVANEHAHFRTAVTREQALESRPIADPLRLLDCSPISDGAAAVVVSTLEWARERVEQPIVVLACEQATGPTSVEELPSFTSLGSTRSAAARAYERAGIRPGDVDVAELHDCFSIAEWIALEDLGLAGRGSAAAVTSAGKTTLGGGGVTVNPSGGLLSKGHPVGATGVAQVIEIVRQLRGEAANQVVGAELGLAQNVGGTGGVASVTLLGPAG